MRLQLFLENLEDKQEENDDQDDPDPAASSPATTTAIPSSTVGGICSTHDEMTSFLFIRFILWQRTQTCNAHMPIIKPIF